MRRLALAVFMLVAFAAPIQAQTPEGTEPDTSEVLDITIIQKLNILIIQKRLNALGYDAGPSDGVLGPQTVAAIRAFEADNGLSNEELDPKAFSELATRLYDSVPDLREGFAATERGDHATALRIFKVHAALGNAYAQNNLGFMYVKGAGVPQDYAEAVKWFRFAAEQGNAGGQYNLGLVYGNGQGVPQDYVRAYMWFGLAAAQGDERARKNRNIVAEQLTPDQIIEAQKLAREWMEKHGQ